MDHTKPLSKKRPFLNKNTGICYDYQELIHVRPGVVLKTGQYGPFRSTDPWPGLGFHWLEAWISRSKRSEFYLSRIYHFRLGRILGHFWVGHTLLLTNVQNNQLFWYYKRPQKWEGRVVLVFCGSKMGQL